MPPKCPSEAGTEEKLSGTSCWSSGGFWSLESSLQPLLCAHASSWCQEQELANGILLERRICSTVPPWLQPGLPGVAEEAPAGRWQCEYRGPCTHRVPLGHLFLLAPFWTLWLCPHSLEDGVSMVSTTLELARSPLRLHPTGRGLYESPPDVFYGFSARLV